MGIPRLRHHILPFSRTALLQGAAYPGYEPFNCINSVVIDGPSLVHNVYSRLLSWFNVDSINMIDALPTCDEVSRGVMLYLLQLRLHGVQIESIYFDGALPISKRETRIMRLESQRRSLETFCAQTKNGFEVSESSSYERSVKPENVMRSRPTPTKYDHVPANSFMVSAVFEDLRSRWNWANISSIVGRDSLSHLAKHEIFPWAGITIMVPGEADAYCAHEAKLLNSCILTNDSDLLLFDLGDNGSVIFLDSVELIECNPAQPLPSQIKAASLCPSLAARRLGVPDLLSFAYELKAHPATALMELVQQSKIAATMIESSHYLQFVNEYRIDHCGVRADETVSPVGHLDSRISELFWQYQLHYKFATGDEPHIYLPILIEDHAKQCAWVKGREYRNIAYSVLNFSRPSNQRHRHVLEFIRRGQRIAQDRIELQGESWISTEIMSLEARMNALQAKLGKVSDSRTFWMLLALQDCYGTGAGFTQSDLQKLQQFLDVGYLGRKLQWADIHLTAQIHAVLYSLRILRQILDSSHLAVAPLRAILGSLPPLHQMIRPARQHTGSRITIAQLSNVFGGLAKGSESRSLTIGTDRRFLAHLHAGTRVTDTVPSHSNIYDVLQG